MMGEIAPLLMSQSLDELPTLSTRNRSDLESTSTRVQFWKESSLLMRRARQGSDIIGT
jgi:hypothetical protein